MQSSDSPLCPGPESVSIRVRVRKDPLSCWLRLRETDIEAEACESRLAARSEQTVNDSEHHPQLKDLRVLVVEDEALIALQLEDMLTELGCAVIGPASRVGQALKLLDGETVEAAVLDLNIAGELVYPVADELRNRGLPYVFVTAFGTSDLTEPYRSRPVLEKPFARRELLQAILDTLRREQ
jgi:CheY-like chemotaxis protein